MNSWISSRLNGFASRQSKNLGDFEGEKCQDFSFDAKAWQCARMLAYDLDINPLNLK
jgi:hypothetical protein